MIKFEDVQVGDRVKLVNENGDTAEVTAVEKEYFRVYSKTNSYWVDDGWTIVETLPKPMPNKPGTILKKICTGTLYVRAFDQWEAVEYGYKYSETDMCAGWNAGNLSVEYEPK